MKRRLFTATVMVVAALSSLVVAPQGANAASNDFHVSSRPRSGPPSYADGNVHRVSPYEVNISAGMYNGGDWADLQIYWGYFGPGQLIQRGQDSLPNGPVYQTTYRGKGIRDSVARIEWVELCMGPGYNDCDIVYP